MSFSRMLNRENALRKPHVVLQMNNWKGAVTPWLEIYLSNGRYMLDSAGPRRPTTANIKTTNAKILSRVKNRTFRISSLTGDQPSVSSVRFLSSLRRLKTPTIHGSKQMIQRIHL